MTKIITLALVATVSIAANAYAQAPDTPSVQVKPHESSNPLLEAAVGFNGPQYSTAEFPGVSLSLAANVLREQKWGGAIIAERDLSYVRASRGIGARMFIRSSGLESGKLGASAFAQILAGAVDAGREGIIVSNGGLLWQPGFGVTLGTSTSSLVVQVDHQFVSGGTIHDEMRGSTESLNRTRVTIGFVQRFFNRRR